jgi:ATP-dependent DNA helicase RecQ
MSTMLTNDLRNDLQNLHGYNMFRDGQKESLESILNDKDTLSILPTSTGKSLVYFMTTYYYRKKYPSKFILVCSPLISLMKDQVTNTPSYLRSTMLGSGQLDKSIETQIWENKFDIVYISPERLRSIMSPNIDRFISLVVIDEAHCVSQDGSTYRPSYLDIGQIRKEFLPNVPILALTATTTQKTRYDIIRLLGLQNPNIVHVGMDRPNLHYSFIPR